MERKTEREPRGARWAVEWTAAQQRGKETAVGLEQSDPKEQGDNGRKSAVGRDKTKHPGPRQRTPGCVSGERGLVWEGSLRHWSVSGSFDTRGDLPGYRLAECLLAAGLPGWGMDGRTDNS